MTSSTRPLRADAARNRSLLLAAAAAEFAARGIDTSIADIAHRAGIGKGTVFRHFASKEQLLAAVVLDRLENLTTLAETMCGADDPGAALLDFLAAAATQQQHDLSLLQISSMSVLHDAQITSTRERMFAAVDTLVTRARGAGALRADITGPDVVLLMCAPNHIAGPLKDVTPELWRRYLGIIFDGLRPEGAHPLPHPAPGSASP